jgi:hypothetical protein
MTSGENKERLERQNENREGVDIDTIGVLMEEYRRMEMALS